MALAVLIVVSFFAWVLSTLAAGGSPFILIPLVNLMLGPASVPPVITVGMGLGNAHRMLLFWSQIDWHLTLWYVPGAIVGAILGAYAYTQIHLEGLQLCIGVFLILSLISFSRKSSSTSPPFACKAWYILPAGCLKAFVSGLIGTTGPVLIPFYLGYGLVKEQLIATKATHVAIVHLIKILTYITLGALSLQDAGIGLLIGLVAIPANWVGKQILDQMDAQQFRHLVLLVMAMSGLWMLWGQRHLFSLG